MIFYFTSDADKSSVETIQQAAELGLISNLLSIVCRFIFQPLEEIAFNLFSKLKGQENQEEQAVDILVQYLAGMCGIGVCGIIFSQVCSYEFILLVYSQQWATPSAVRIMKAYCVYLLGMSMNGMSEAFAYGMASKPVLTQLQGLMVFNSALYIALVIAFSSKFGIVGLVIANCVNMLIRAVMSLKISLDSRNEGNSNPITLLQLTLRILSNKFFVGLVALGAVATPIAKFALTHILVNVLKRELH